MTNRHHGETRMTFLSLRRLAASLAVASLLTMGDAHSADAWLQSRPCGPDSLRGPLRLLIPQGAFGGDFRPACRRHDACYDTPGANRAACDARFLADMLDSCADARRPVLCRMTARVMHRATTKRGEEAFQSAQAIAFEKLGGR